MKPLLNVSSFASGKAAFINNVTQEGEGGMNQILASRGLDLNLKGEASLVSLIPSSRQVVEASLQV